MSGYSEALEMQIKAQAIIKANLTEVQQEMRREEDVGDALHFTISRAAYAGDTYFFSRDVLALLEGAARTLPRSVVLHSAMLPSHTAFCYMERPVAIDDREPITCVAWTCNEETAYFAAMNMNQAGLLPMLGGGWMFGESIEQTLPHADDSELALKVVSFMGAMFLFLNQRILRYTNERPDRATRRRMPVFESEPVIRVVSLRRVNYQHKDSTEHEAVEWSCQWLVRGFWRNQWYPSLGNHQPKWIAPYIKGPADKPLKQPRADIFAVVR